MTDTTLPYTMVGAPNAIDGQKGHRTISDYVDDSGKFSHAHYGYSGVCKHCNIALVSDETFDTRNDLRIIHFKLQK